MKPIFKRFVANLQRGAFRTANGTELQVHRSPTPDLEISPVHQDSFVHHPGQRLTGRGRKCPPAATCLDRGISGQISDISTKIQRKEEQRANEEDVPDQIKHLGCSTHTCGTSADSRPPQILALCWLLINPAGTERRVAARGRARRAQVTAHHTPKSHILVLPSRSRLISHLTVPS